jgi:hypothetical protein
MFFYMAALALACRGKGSKLGMALLLFGCADGQL